MVRTRADFVFRPRRRAQADQQQPIAVFTDGFSYHKDRIHEDTVQRAAVLRSGKYRVWTLTYKDVQQAYRSQGDYYTDTLGTEGMPCGNLYVETVRRLGAEQLKVRGLKPFELLLRYLGTENAEALFRAHAYAYAMCLLEPRKMQSEKDFVSWSEVVQPIIDAVDYIEELFVFGDTMFGEWQPAGARDFLRIWAAASRRELATKKNAYAPTVICALDDTTLDRGDRFDAAWNGFWHFANMMQFLPRFAAVTVRGIQEAVYAPISVRIDVPDDGPAAVDASLWDEEVYELLFDPEARVAAQRMERQGLPPPSAVGFELTTERGEFLALAEMAWEAEKVV